MYGNNRSALVIFFIFVLLGLVIVVQFMMMVQADRLYERVNRMADDLADRGVGVGAAESGGSAGEKYPGDEGDWLVWSIVADLTTMNPIVATSQYERYVLSGNVFESLLEYDPDKMVLRPLLAESFEVSDDGLQIDFTLRDDIYFSDGEPITADDVVFTYKTIVTPGVDAASLANYYKDIDHVEKLDERRVKFVMKQVYFKSLEFTGGMEILPEHVYKFDDAQEFNIRRDNPVGSGPYVLDKWEMGREIVLKRNDNYWGKQPNVKKIVYKVITNDVAALQSLRSHDVDFLRPLPEQYFELSKDEDFTDDFRCMSYWTPSAGYFYIGWNSGSPYFADAKVRLAMTHLVDRESILKFLLKTPEARIPVGPFYINGAQTNPAIKAWPFDVARAAKLLDEAGWVDSDGDGLRDKNGVPFRFRYMIGSGVLIHEQVAKLVKDAGAKVGIDISLEPYEWSVFIQKLHDRDFDAVSLAWGGGGLQSDPYQIWHSSQSAGGGSNYVGFGDEETDGLIELARRTLDENERNKLYHRLGDIIHREQPYTFIYTRPEQRFLDKRFENVILHKLGLNQFEWYVPKVDQKY